MPRQRGNDQRPQLLPARQVLAARTAPAEEDTRSTPGPMRLKKHGLRQRDPGAGPKARVGTRAGPAGEDGKEEQRDRASPQAKEEEKGPRARDQVEREADGTPSGSEKLILGHFLRHGTFVNPGCDVWTAHGIRPFSGAYFQLTLLSASFVHCTLLSLCKAIGVFLVFFCYLSRAVLLLIRLQREG